MATSQGEFALRVLGNSVMCWNKTFDGVAFFAGGAVYSVRELAAMLIFVAIFARGVRNRIGHLAGGVALVAGDADMLANQRETSFVMIEVFRHLRNGEIFRRVAACAVSSEFAFVNIFVAGVTGGEVKGFEDRGALKRMIRVLNEMLRQVLKLIPAYGTLRTGDFDVLARQRVLGFVVRELRCGNPFLGVMARCAIIGQLLAVFVSVT